MWDDKKKKDEHARQSRKRNWLAVVTAAAVEADNNGNLAARWEWDTANIYDKSSVA